LDATTGDAGFAVVMDGGQDGIEMAAAAAFRVGISKMAVGLELSILVDPSAADDFSLAVLKNHLG
jgi:hypothetical protein